MTPVLMLGTGILILWALFTGRALALYNAITKGT